MWGEAGWRVALSRLWLPQGCPGCGRQLDGERGLCGRCQQDLRPRVEAHSPLSPVPEPHLVTLGPYRGPARRAVRALKFGGARDLATVLGGALASGVPTDWRIGAVVPVPLHPSRERQRGYNQAELLARALAHALQVPCVPALTRTRATRQQSKRHGADRAAIAGAFVADARRLTGEPILLVDDVMTTGSTLRACQDALRAAGQRAVYAVVVAR